MKRFIQTIVLALLLLPNLANAQQEMGPVGPTWSFPVVYNYDEEVTWYFDLSTTQFAMGEDIYIWIWSPSEPDAGNWENSSDFAKLTYVSGMTWKFTLTPTLYFSMTPEAIAGSAGFWFRLKDDAGTKQSDVANIAYTPFSSFYTANELIRAYPTAPSIDKGLSILFNANLAPGFEGATSVHMHSGLNNWDLQVQYQSWIPEVVLKTKLKELGNGFYKMDLVPKEYFAAPDGYIMQNMNFLFVKDDWASTTPDQVLNAAEYVPPPPPVFSFFPQQISKRDFLGIIRTNNEPGIIKLLYTVTAGATQITGEINGSMTEIKGFVNLPTALQNVNATEIHVLVKDNTDRTISDTTIPLKTLD
ncbi:hypothetical protein [Flavobacterium caeni]|uniref:Uncharacterized protein n=1 Tax=Flavobacterium caeni TaxID=490189 RepID=A0A1G5E2J0_9FLAO|nr:hypothetical protein [Flavobacterium caeni]SCY20941.1 hypothetical protein SAMN02927903_00913 [Flavobacterium caeni]